MDREGQTLVRGVQENNKSSGIRNTTQFLRVHGYWIPMSGSSGSGTVSNVSLVKTYVVL